MNNVWGSSIEISEVEQVHCFMPMGMNTLATGLMIGKQDMVYLQWPMVIGIGEVVHKTLSVLTNSSDN
jgi:hypothetical protein